MTASLLAVMERLPVYLLERLLGAAAGDSALSLVAFTNQVRIGARHSRVPDAGITAHVQWLFEVKTEIDAVDEKQLRGHLKLFTDNDEIQSRLFVLTPDEIEPKVIAALKDDRVVWFSFAQLNKAIDSLLDEQRDLAGERITFLLRELQTLFYQDGLLDRDNVVVVAARWAYPEYLANSVYICQPGRSFKSGVSHMAFYAESEIKPEVARILDRRDQVVFSRTNAEALSASSEEFDKEVGRQIIRSLNSEIRAEDQPHQIFLLTAAKSSDTIRLGHPIVNDATDKAGKPCAWTFEQRYTRTASLRQEPTTTSGLK
ncbi:hypothetical protein ACWDTD_20085 [Gordonia sp. NPDC003425]